MYAIRRIPEDGSLLGLQVAKLDQFPWDTTGFRPETDAVAGYTSHSLVVRMRCREPNPRACVTQCGGPVCEDSCLEFFLMPNPERSMRYLNLEMNPKGVVHLGLGEGRPGRTVYSTLPDTVTVTPLPMADGYWGVLAELDFRFFEEAFGARPSQSLRGNFYTCGDKTDSPRYGMYIAYDLPRPDFHYPEGFGDFTMIP